MLLGFKRPFCKRGFFKIKVLKLVSELADLTSSRRLFHNLSALDGRCTGEPLVSRLDLGTTNPVMVEDLRLLAGFYGV